MARRTTKARPVRSQQLSWGQWSDGAWWELRMGEDHDQTPRRAAHAARVWAARNGYRAEVSITHPDTPAGNTQPWHIRFVARRGGGPLPPHDEYTSRADSRG